jgi:peptidoglycan/xylan/chitin deacetylase (PgdA/CDA1 family)
MIHQAPRCLFRLLRLLVAAMLLGSLLAPRTGWALEKIPDRLVVLTFDDSVASQATFVAPLLKKYGFGATFFITEGFEFTTDKEHYMTWEQIEALHRDGFEIGNHTRAHKAVDSQDAPNLVSDIAYIEEQCQKRSIPVPTSFCYPGYRTSPGAVQALLHRGYRFARAGGNRCYDPTQDHPLTLPQAFDGKPHCTPELFAKAIEGARDGKIAILTFHGVPDIRHPWVSTECEKFEAYMAHLHAQGCRVIALRDLSRYVAGGAAWTRPEAPSPGTPEPSPTQPR